MPAITAADRRRFKELAKRDGEASVERMRREAFMEASRELAVELGQLIVEEGDFPVRSKSRPWHVYQMNMTPEGYAVHQGEGCPGEPFNGPLACKHSKEHSMTSLVPAQPQALANRQQFSGEEIQVIKNTICRGASDTELGLFLATCKSTGLNPFMKQIHCVMRNVNTGSREKPSWQKQMTIVVGVDGYRVVRDRLVDRDGNSYFDGMEGPQWSNDGVNWLDAWFDTKPPKLARVAIYRKGIARPFVAQARWDAYNQKNAMWEAMGPEQLAKCAEVLALRRAFPADMGALPSGSLADLEPPDLADLPAPVADLIQGDTPSLSGSTPVDGEWSETPDSASVGASAPPDDRPSPTPTCEHVATFDEKSTLMVCSKCGVVLEEPPPGSGQASLV